MVRLGLASAQARFSSPVASSEYAYVWDAVLYLDSERSLSERMHLKLSLSEQGKGTLPNRSSKQPIRASQRVHRNEANSILVVALIATYAFLAVS